MATVLITGGSGLIGRRLTQLLLQEGHHVRHLGRNARPGAQVHSFTWDLAKGRMDPDALMEVDHIVHLSGAGIVDQRWTPQRVGELHASRAAAAELLLQAASTHGHWPKTFISAGGINWYGTITGQHVFTEEDPPAQDMLGQLCQAWEQAAAAWSGHCRVAVLRMPMVLAREGGALPKLAGPARWGLAGPLGTGKQWMPWAHVEDVARAYHFLMQREDLHGAWNIAAPEQVDNRAFIREVANALHRPCFLPAVPAWLLRALLGARSAMVLEGSRVSGEKLLRAGFVLRHPALAPALRSLLQ
jgi:uncharacterized protein (TIGR01777 family)